MITTVIKNILSEFYDVPACVLASKEQVLSVALGQNSHDAYLKALDKNPAEMFGAYVGFSKEFDEKTLKHITACKQNIVKTNYDLKKYKKTVINEALSTDTDTENARLLSLSLDKDKFKVRTKTVPTSEQIEDAVFAWKVSKYLSGGNLMIAKDFKTLSLSQNIEDIETEIEKAVDFACADAKNSVLHTSVDILPEHIINVCAQGRIGLIIYSGGNADDKNLIKLAEKLNLAIISTGISIIRR